jgi:methyl-accepting chemotaxis protein
MIPLITMEVMMGDRPHILRRNHFIKKGFQINFSIRFLALIIIEAILLGGLFWYVSSNTLTTGYVGSQLRIENTSSFFFPSMMVYHLLVIVIVGIIGAVGLLFISHKIAGPLYRFEASLKEISEGDLTHRISTRKNDQLKDLADSLNGFTSVIDEKVKDLKQHMQDVSGQMEKLQKGLSSGEQNDVDGIGDITNSLENMQSILDEFKTSDDNDSKGRED